MSRITNRALIEKCVSFFKTDGCCRRCPCLYDDEDDACIVFMGCFLEPFNYEEALKLGILKDDWLDSDVSCNKQISGWRDLRKED
jgi:hypothetical protein